MQLTEIQYLGADYSTRDLDELVAVIQSVVLSTPSLVLRWEKVDATEGRQWLTQSYGRSFEDEFQLKRISTLTKTDGLLPSELYAEHLVVRDLDLDHVESVDDHPSYGSSLPPSPPPGRIIAHADYRFTPAMGNTTEKPAEINTADPAVKFPTGFNKDLHIVINDMIMTSLIDLFRGLPCFDLEGIATLTPSHVRKGVARRLTEWVFPYADRFALPVILAANPLGLPLYRKCGFEEYPQHDIVVDMAGYGGTGIHRHRVMVRWPTQPDKLPPAWREWKAIHRPSLD